jgi:hypothetical protein
MYILFQMYFVSVPDVPSWLKSLRLHKYAFLFAHLTFDEMLSLNEEKLEVQGVTKGARHKIVLSVSKLRERSQHMKKVFEEMTGEKESIRNALNEVKWTLTTPIQPAALQPLLPRDNTTGGVGGGGEGGEGGNAKVEGSPPPPPNVMAPIGTNRFQDENSSAENTSRAADQLFRREPSSSAGGGTRDNETEDELTGWIVRTVGKGKMDGPMSYAIYDLRSRPTNKTFDYSL